jgi:hypothetical protein
MLEIPVPSQVRRGESLPTGTIEEIKGERRKMDPGFEKSQKKSSPMRRFLPRQEGWSLLKVLLTR